ncbi:carbamoyl-phosphate synthase small subunit [Salegentibacter agarivorans]|jgi:carbamoyl-phosphate synthase small subunit|uniref:Carbamoyl phosphate synthase small chain n=1 Tax=Salegentibacter agarivorans TaxID=345907 RepID=A0A1I2LKA9_9FLAO|nr:MULTISPECIES: glutamine-hydrolyzing carbamoyl-phosphate synthase small subunit [Salegentibacter]APS37657.1 carbamoyl phosphate synthase small subunit [Salegentibacter sp. T436]SFF79533.1 carbamoyl-phosphate synthase small subunit [Salegentibacter agarivorans]|tara:strand:+ start:1612 stop:2724 length:1113 start_codon:yes stop_codon:yes gene_type:complete
MKYQTRKKAIILLEDGTIFHGKAVGDKDGKAVGEVCFNTGMTGYQEIFTDPSYYGQLMVTTNAHIGNYGTLAEESESDKAKISGLICKNFSYTHSRPAADKSLQEFLDDSNLFAISDVDTRALVTYIRENGAMNAIISTDVDNIEGLKKELAEVPDMNGLELASKVSTKEPYYFGNENATYKIAALDVGIKKNILRNFDQRDVYVKVFPYNATYEEMSEWNPDGYFLSNGPGDPAPLDSAINLTKTIIEKDHPLFGICLGHQIIAIANGIKTYKMHHGHRGINHPVKNLKTGKGEITSQNHGFSVDKAETEANNEVEITHICLNDDTVGGIAMKNKNCFSVQYHPEASPGPHDASYLFDEFMDRIKRVKA